MDSLAFFRIFDESIPVEAIRLHYQLDFWSAKSSNSFLPLLEMTFDRLSFDPLQISLNLPIFSYLMFFIDFFTFKARLISPSSTKLFHDRGICRSNKLINLSQRPAFKVKTSIFSSFPCTNNGIPLSISNFLIPRCDCPTSSFIEFPSSSSEISTFLNLSVSSSLFSIPITIGERCEFNFQPAEIIGTNQKTGFNQSFSSMMLQGRINPTLENLIDSQFLSAQFDWIWICSNRSDTRNFNPPQRNYNESNENYFLKSCGLSFKENIILSSKYRPTIFLTLNNSNLISFRNLSFQLQFRYRMNSSISNQFLTSRQSSKHFNEILLDSSKINSPPQIPIQIRILDEFASPFFPERYFNGEYFLSSRSNLIVEFSFFPSLINSFPNYRTLYFNSFDNIRIIQNNIPMQFINSSNILLLTYLPTPILRLNISLKFLNLSQRFSLEFPFQFQWNFNNISIPSQLTRQISSIPIVWINSPAVSQLNSSPSSDCFYENIVLNSQLGFNSQFSLNCTSLKNNFNLIYSNISIISLIELSFISTADSSLKYFNSYELIATTEFENDFFWSNLRYPTESFESSQWKINLKISIYSPFSQRFLDWKQIINLSHKISSQEISIQKFNNFLSSVTRSLSIFDYSTAFAISSYQKSGNLIEKCFDFSNQFQLNRSAIELNRPILLNWLSLIKSEKLIESEEIQKFQKSSVYFRFDLNSLSPINIFKSYSGLDSSPSFTSSAAKSSDSPISITFSFSSIGLWFLLIIGIFIPLFHFIYRNLKNLII